MIPKATIKKSRIHVGTAQAGGDRRRPGLLHVDRIFIEMDCLIVDTCIHSSHVYNFKTVESPTYRRFKVRVFAL